MTVLSFGCKKKGGDMKEAMAKMEGFKTAMCACKSGDKACAEKVNKDMQAYADSMKGKEKDMKPSPEDEKKMAPVVAEMTKCMTAAMTDPAAAAPPTGDMKPADPAAAGGTAPASGDKPADPAAPAGGAAPAAGGDMKKDETKKDEKK
ncbi:MAG TPA: hypothetical protein VNO30_38965 [Kofleriaceae bacterium]|nr:hypothetical protein [Kofleriaceae bacterium]